MNEDYTKWLSYFLCLGLADAMEHGDWDVAKKIHQELATRISQGQFPEHAE